MACLSTTCTAAKAWVIMWGCLSTSPTLATGQTTVWSCLCTTSTSARARTTMWACPPTPLMPDTCPNPRVGVPSQNTMSFLDQNVSMFAHNTYACHNSDHHVGVSTHNTHLHFSPEYCMVWASPSTILTYTKVQIIVWAHPNNNHLRSPTHRGAGRPYPPRLRPRRPCWCVQLQDQRQLTPSFSPVDLKFST